jgi:hypothetical protein
LKTLCRQAQLCCMISWLVLGQSFQSSTVSCSAKRVDYDGVLLFSEN